MKKPEDTGTIAVIAELFEGELRPVTHELVGFAEKLQQLISARIRILVLGEDIEKPAADLAKTTGKDILGIQAPELAQYNGQVYQAVLHAVLKDYPPAYICTAHSSRGWDFAPGLAVRLKAACITGVNRVSGRKNTVCFSRELYGGKVSADMQSTAPTTLVTVLPGSCRPSPDPNRMPGEVHLISASITPQPSKTVSTRLHQASYVDLSQAKVIVSAGRGIGDAENLSLIHDLSAAIPRSMVCGSRPVIDLGWLSYDRQVGVTGASVSPDLYMACGISGATQHVSGMQGSAFVVSINTDPMAAIFNQSDICIVEDLTTFIPVLLEKLGEFKAG